MLCHFIEVYQIDTLSNLYKLAELIIENAYFINLPYLP